MLGHDTHGHAEADTHGLHRLPADRRRRRRPTAATCSASSAPSYTDKGATGRRPVADRRPARSRSARSTRRSSSSSTSPARPRRPTPTAAAACTAAASRQRDWIQLNGPFNLLQIDIGHVPLRGRGRRPHRRLAAGGDRGPHGLDHRARSSTTANLTSRRAATGRSGRARRSRSRSTGKHELFFVFRTVTGGATGSNLFNLNWVEFNGNGVTVVRDRTPGGASAAPCRRRCRCRSARRPRSGRSRRASRRTYTARTTANVISTAGDATLSVAPSPAYLTNGAFTLPQPLQVALEQVGVDGPDVQRHGGHRVQAVDRGQRRAAHGQLQQDADVHVVDHDSVRVCGEAAAVPSGSRGGFAVLARVEQIDHEDERLVR